MPKKVQRGTRLLCNCFVFKLEALDAKKMHSAQKVVQGELCGLMKKKRGLTKNCNSRALFSREAPIKIISDGIDIQFSNIKSITVLDKWQLLIHLHAPPMVYRSQMKLKPKSMGSARQGLEISNFETRNNAGAWQTLGRNS